MKLYQERVVEEKKALDAKLAKLEAFLGTGKFTAIQREERAKMRRQYVIMGLYSEVLGSRIEAFE